MREQTKPAPSRQFWQHLHLRSFHNLKKAWLEFSSGICIVEYMFVFRSSAYFLLYKFSTRYEKGKVQQETVRFNSSVKICFFLNATQQVAKDCDAAIISGKLQIFFLCYNDCKEEAICANE